MRLDAGNRCLWRFQYGIRARQARQAWSVPLSDVRKRGCDGHRLDDRPALCQAIPPAYTEHIGWQLLQHLEVSA